MSLIQNEQYIIHNITNADTLSGLSLLYNIDINVLKKVNNISTGEIWGFSYLKIPKTAHSSEPKSISVNKEYYENSKKTDNLKLLKNLTNEADNVINIIYSHTKENFKKSLNVLEEISALQKKHSVDVNTILAYYLVYCDDNENVFKLIEEKILENKNKVKLKSGRSANFIKSHSLEGKSSSNRNASNESSSTSEFINVNKMKHSFLKKSCQSFTYVKDLIKKNLPILNLESKMDNEESKIDNKESKIDSEELKENRKREENNIWKESGMNPSFIYNPSKIKSDTYISDEEITENKNCTDHYWSVLRNNSSNVLRRRA